MDTKFWKGLAVGLFITSTLSYAVVTFNTFTSGTTISSSQVNANFSTIKSKLDALDIGFVGSISTNAVINCVSGMNPSYPTDYTQLTLSADYSDGNFASNEYTIPAAGIYRIFFQAYTEDSMGSFVIVETSSDGGSTWNQSISLGGMGSQNTVVKFAAGTKIRVSAGCGNSNAGADTTVDSAKFTFAIKLF